MARVRRGASMWTRAMALIAVGVGTAALGQAGKAQGTVTVAKTKVTLASAMAVGYKAPNGQLISVLLSDKPANAKEFATDTRIGAGESYVAGIFEGAWKSQHAGKKLSGFMFTIGPKGTLMTEEFLVGGQNNTFSIGNDEYILDLKSTTPRLAPGPASSIAQGAAPPGGGPAYLGRCGGSQPRERGCREAGPHTLPTAL